MKPLVFLLICSSLLALDIIERPIVFNELRINLTKEYIQKHYGLEVDNIHITPRIIVIHWTAINDLKRSLARFTQPLLPSDRPDIQKASALNVSAHFMVDREGNIYRLMDETLMARHIIGLNYSSIGIENVGGEGNIDNLTPQQLAANIQLIQYLRTRHKDIDYLIGHDEYTDFTHHPLWLEKDKNYRTLKYDPGKAFMSKLRRHFPQLKGAP